MAGYMERSHDRPEDPNTFGLREEMAFIDQQTGYMNDILGRSNSLIEGAAQHEHNQRVPACTFHQGGSHNKNCGRGIDTSLMEWYFLRSKGLVPERPYEEWGCDDEARELYLQQGWNKKVTMGFRPVNWDKGFTGRGMKNKAMKRSDDVGPMGELEPTNASPWQLERRRQDKEVFLHDDKKGDRPHRSEALSEREVPLLNNNLAGVGPSSCNGMAVEGNGWSSGNRTGHVMAVARSCCQLIDKVLHKLPGGATSATRGEVADRHEETIQGDRALNGVTNTVESSAQALETTNAGETQLRWNSLVAPEDEDSKVVERVSQAKMFQATDTREGSVFDQTRNDLKHTGSREPNQVDNSPAAESPSEIEFVKTKKRAGDDLEPPGEERQNKRLHAFQSEDDVASDEVMNAMTGLNSPGDLNISNNLEQQPARLDDAHIREEYSDESETEDMSVRPTYAPHNPRNEGNEADEIVVMNVKRKRTGRVCLAKHPFRAWTLQEEEDLRFWVQDYGQTKWAVIAWCLNRSKSECKKRCRQVIIARNEDAGRDAYAGLPEDLTPAALPERDLLIRLLRPRIRPAGSKFQCGDVVYDPKARTLPRISETGNVVNSKGEYMFGCQGEINMALKYSQPRRKPGQKLYLSSRPPREGEEDGTPIVDDRRPREGSVAMRSDSGAWRYGVARRAGHRRRSSALH